MATVVGAVPLAATSLVGLLHANLQPELHHLYIHSVGMDGHETQPRTGKHSNDGDQTTIRTTGWRSGGGGGGVSKTVVYIALLLVSRALLEATADARFPESLQTGGGRGKGWAGPSAFDHRKTLCKRRTRQRNKRL